MKKILALVLSVMFTLGMVACSQNEYKVEIADNYPIANELDKTYSEGEEVTIKLETITEHYYIVYVNGVEQAMATSDLMYTYFTFTMPSEDVLIKIEDVSVDIPEAPQE